MEEIALRGPFRSTRRRVGGPLRWAVLAPMVAVLTGVPLVVSADTASATITASPRRVTVVGDSLTVGTTRLKTALLSDGWADVLVDAKVGRHIAATGATAMSGILTIRALRASGWDTPDWVVALGTNDTAAFGTVASTERYLQAVVDAVGSGHRIAFVTLALPHELAAAEHFNEVVTDWAVAQPERFLVIDWATQAYANRSWFAADAVHYGATGYRNREAVETRALAAWIEPTASEYDGDAAPALDGFTGGGGIDAVPLTRVVDSRRGLGLARLAAGVDAVVDLTGAAPPAGTSGAVLDVTATGAAADGYLSLHPCGVPATTSTTNFGAGEDVAALAVSTLSDAKVCITASVATDVVIDLAGWVVPDGGRLSAIRPVRVLDTRTAASRAGATRVTSARVTLGGAVDVPEGATGVLLNLTIAGSSAASYVTATNCASASDGSNVNAGAGSTVADAALVALEGSGDLCFSAPVAVDLVVDVVGWITSASASPAGAPAGHLVLGVPVRVLDTRDGTGGWTGRLAAGQTIRLAVTPPAGASGAVVNVTSTATAADGYVLVAACSAGTPATSTSNPAVAHDRADSTVVALDGSGICITASVRTDIVLDVDGIVV